MIALLRASLLALLGTATVVSADIPLPPDVKIVAPGPDVPADVAAFVGKWAGEWSGVLKSVLIIEEIDGDKAKLIYAWDDAPSWRTEKGGGYHREGKVVRGNPTRIEFGAFVVKMGSTADTVEVTRVIPQRVDVATFTRSR